MNAIGSFIQDKYADDHKLSNSYAGRNNSK